jgi:methylated-DNA-[protein]-cysteine S-methyltransferase
LAEQLFQYTVSTKVGPLTIVVDSLDRLVRILFHGEEHESARADRDRCNGVAVQLADYFAGSRSDFDLELGLQGTDFQKRVWEEVRLIPHGETVSYGEIARRLGDPGTVRAVGAANGANPVPIVIPCHRVIGSDGSLVGYGGGVNVKAALLRHEGALVLAEQPRLDFGY